uniref:Uncharacterized protein n=1 Tax=Avena sativa TaxID=4498 RepID=A0ACD5V0B9_AVESA
MTSSSSSHHHDASSTNSTPRASAGSTSSNGTGNGNGNGGNYHHHPPLPPPARSQGQVLPPPGPCVRIMCSFGGRILPRPGDHQLRYVGGETRIVSVPRTASYALLTVALARLVPALFAPGAPEPTLRYQLPQDDLDSLISVSSSDDVDNLMDELDRIQALTANAIKPPRLRLFVFASSPDHSSSAAFGSVLSGTADASTDQWFVDQLNAPAPPCPSSIDRGRSEASSMLSGNMDYLTGLDAASDDPNPAPVAQLKSDTEVAHGDDDDEPVPVMGAPLATYVAENARWPAPPPRYMQEPVYLVPVRPVHYLDAAGRQAGYMPGPVYHMVGGRGNEDLYASGTVGGVYGVPHPVQPFRQVIYAPPLAPADDYQVEGKPSVSEGGSHSS